MAFPNYSKAENWGVRVGKASSREGTKIDSLVLHAMAGSYEGSMRWANDSADTSFHYGVSQTGRVGQAVDEQWAAWHAGNWNMNKRSVGIEHEDFQKATVDSTWMTPRMFEESTKLAAYLCKKYSIPVSRIYLHKQVTLTSTLCPGNYFPLQRYKNRVLALLGGTTPPPPSSTSTYPTITRTQFLTMPINELNRGYNLTEGGKLFGIFYPATSSGGLEEISRWQFGRLVIPKDVQKKYALTFEGKVFGIFSPKTGTESVIKVNNTEKAIAWAMGLNKLTPKYWCWDGGSLDRQWVSGRPGAIDGFLPPISDIKNLFCADLTSLMLRAIGKPVPKNSIYPGGTRAFRLAYQNVMVPFKLGEFRRGDVAFIDYQARGVNFEGHIGVALGGPDAKFLQSFAWNCRDLEPGLNAQWTLRQSHDGGYYTHRIPREKIWG